jgi:phenylpropionate dioxygenase-like ring-hydroxylating dioxygenase large terminal subunit
MPSGWFRIALSAELGRDQVSVFRLNGREVVAFRSARNGVAVFDPHCPHMGAHLGYGGRVVEGALRCPFHGLRFDARGSCVGTEYPGDPEVKLSVRSWPVVEQLGCIFVYDGPEDPPRWQLPAYETAGWTDPITKVLRLKGHVQDVAENSVDFGHFAAVHGYTDLEDPIVRIEGPHLYSKFGFARRNPLFPWSDVQSTFDTVVHGLGLSVTDLRSPKLGIHYRVALTATQLDESTMSFGIGVSAELPPPFVPKELRWLPLPWNAAIKAQIRLIHRFIVADVLQDKEIWEHRIPVDNPGLIPGDGPIAKFRRWVRQFYERA